VSGAEDEKVFMIGAAAACALMNSAGVAGVRDRRTLENAGAIPILSNSAFLRFLAPACAHRLANLVSARSCKPGHISAMPKRHCPLWCVLSFVGVVARETLEEDRTWTWTGPFVNAACYFNRR
jgi:hypothetical protein